jgi:hypothetical protein
MPSDSRGGDHGLEARVIRAAEAALEFQKFVAPIDVLVGLGWLTTAHVNQWRQGRVDYLERSINANLNKISRAMRIFRRWAQQRGLQPSETAYFARARHRRDLRFSKSGNPTIEQAYRTHWVSSQLGAKRIARIQERQSKPPDLVVISPLKEWTCASCGGTGQFLLMQEVGPLCLVCAEMEHLVFLPAGHAGLSRRARAESSLSAVVVRFSRSRKRYERRGLLVEAAALAQAEADPGQGQGGSVELPVSD